MVKSYKERVKARLPVVTAEVGNVENHQVATLGLCCISADLSQCEDILDKALAMARGLGDAVLLDARREVLPFGEGGSELRGGLERALSEVAFDNKYGEE